MSARERLDAALVSRGLAVSRTQAKTLVTGGAVLVDGTPVDKPSFPVLPDQQVVVRDSPTGGEADWITAGWVGRGALKLVHAFAVWAPEGLSVQGRRCLDVGASTGGFTQVLLDRGAAEVVALDVGHGQLDPRVGERPEVVDLSGTSIRDVDASTIGGAVGAVVGDVSFISLRHVLPVLPGLCRDDAEVVLLVKPQFEVGAARLGRNGVVRSARDRSDTLREVVDLAGRAGFAVGGIERSPVVGGGGNIEYLLWLRTGPARSGMMDWGMSPEDVASRCVSLRLEEER